MSVRPAEKPKVYDGQFNARLQRLERMVGQDSGGSSGDGLPSYDDSDIGKVLTVVSEYETTGEAIQTQSVTLVNSVGTLDAQKVDASKWTDGQLVSVVFNGTTYVLEIADIEGSLSVGNEHFQLYYHSDTGVMTIEAIDAESPVTVSAQYVTEHANADWAEPSGGSGGLVIHVLYDEQEDALYLDKNYTEITTALLSGSSVVFIWENTDTAPGYEEVQIYLFNEFGIDSDGYYVSLNQSNTNIFYRASSPTGILRQGGK